MPAAPAPAPKAHRFSRRQLAAIIIGAFIALGIIGSLLGKPKPVDAASPKPTPTAPTSPTTAPQSVAPTAPPAAPASVAPGFTVSQQQAIESAQGYLDTGGGFSKSGLIGQLSSKYGEGFPKADAVFAVNHISVNWNQQAAKSAHGYLDVGGFSCQGLISQLESSYGEGFTHSQAVYGANSTGVCG